MAKQLIRTTQPQNGVLLNVYAASFACFPLQNKGVMTGVSVGAAADGMSYVFPNATGLTNAVDFGNSAQDIFYLSPGWALIRFNPGSSANWHAISNYIAK